MTIDVSKVGQSIKKSINDAKEKDPTTFNVTSGLIGGLSAVTSVLCVKSGITRLANNENTYGGIIPVVTIGIGTALGALAIKALSGPVKYLKRKKNFEIIMRNSDSEEKK